MNTIVNVACSHTAPCYIYVYLPECYCGEESREIVCGSDGVYSPNYSCKKVCGKDLTCGNHKCTQLCHSGPCPPCDTSPEVVKSCSCGKMPLYKLENVVPRTSCMDPLPLCDQICGKVLSCGTKCKCVLIWLFLYYFLYHDL